MIALVTWLWQGLAIAFATAALLACARTLNATTRHAICWLACAAVLSLPLLYVLAAPASDAATLPTPLLVPAPPDSLPAFMLLAWCVFVAAGLLRIAWSVRTVFHLKRAGEPLDPADRSRLRTLHAGTTATCVPEIRVWDGPGAACALGLGRPVILLSRLLTRRLADDDLEAIVMHERAHLERRDDWWQLLQAIVYALAGWHPAVWLLGRRIALEREAACDDHVVLVTGAARQYARALVQAAAARGSSPIGAGLPAIPAAITSASVLRRRVRRLLDLNIDRGTSPSLRNTVLGLVALAGVLTATARIPQVVVFVEAVANVPRVERPGARAFVSPAQPRASTPAHSASGTEASASRLGAPVQPPGGRRAPYGVAPGGVQEPSARAVIGQVDAVTAVTDVPRPDNAQPDTVTASAPLADAAGTEPPAPLLTSRSPWGTVARSTTAAGQHLATSGAATGDRTREAGRSIGRFFSKGGKAVARGF